MAPRRSRSFVFTMNDPAAALVDQLKAHECVYMIFGRETAPTTGRVHYQGFVYYRNGRTFNSVRKALQLLHSGTHVEIAHGSVEENFEYCSKDGDFIEVGVVPLSNADKGQAEIDRWDEARAHAAAGEFDLVPSDIILRNAGGVKWIRSLALESRVLLEIDGHLVNDWFWGEAGTGKSRKARDDNPDAFLKAKNKWWNGYQHEDVVIIDDIDPSHAKYQFGPRLKEWADRYPFMAETKGGVMKIRPKKIVVTSQYSIDECFPNDLQTQAALRRRFKVTHFGGL